MQTQHDMGGDDQVAARVQLGLDAPRAVVAGKVYSRARQVQRDEIQKAVGVSFCLRNAHELVGIVEGVRVAIGAFRFGARPVRWDYWFPHLGIAVDRAVLPLDESIAKAAWATTFGVSYFSPRVNAPNDQLDLIGLAEAAAARRAACEGGRA